MTEPLIHGLGTPAAAWRAWDGAFPPFDLTGCARLVVVAPHPDDEVLGVGGLMALAVRAGVPVDVVAVTDGGGSHPGSPTLGPADLLRLRPAESVAALTRLGVRRAPLRLGVPDGAVAAHEDAVSAAVAAVVRDPGACDDGAGVDGAGGRSATWVVTTWRGDGHPDHEATGRACAGACAETGARLVEHPVWTWHWARPGDPRVPWERAASLSLPPDVAGAKVDAVACFATQVRALSEHPADAPVLGAHVLERLLREEEVLFT